MKKKFGKKGKSYGDFLSLLLVITIIAILTLVGYLVYKVVSKRNIEANASSANDEFLEIAKQNKKALEEDVSGDVDYDTLKEAIEETKTDNGESNNNQNNRNIKKAYLGQYEIKGSINIPKTNCQYPILEKVTPDSLKRSVALLDVVSGSSVEGKVRDLNIPGTNAFILGHNYLNGQFFSNNDKLAIGDTIQITDQVGTVITYTIYNMFYAQPEDVSFMEREVEANTREITLQTCNNNSSQRLIIFAKDN